MKKHNSSSTTSRHLRFSQQVARSIVQGSVQHPRPWASTIWNNLGLFDRFESQWHRMPYLMGHTNKSLPSHWTFLGPSSQQAAYNPWIYQFGYFIQTNVPCVFHHDHVPPLSLGLSTSEKADVLIITKVLVIHKFKLCDQRDHEDPYFGL